MSQITPKLFTASTGEKVVQNKGFIFPIFHPPSTTFLDRTVAARRPEKRRREHGWDNPGQPGKGWWQLVPPSPPNRVSGEAGKYHQFLWPESCPVSLSTNQELSGEARLETACEPSQARGAFRPARRRSYPRGFRLLLRRPERSRIVRRANPAKRPRSLTRAGRARMVWRRGANGPGKVRQPPHWGSMKKHAAPLQKRKQSES